MKIMKGWLFAGVLLLPGYMLHAHPYQIARFSRVVAYRAQKPLTRSFSQSIPPKPPTIPQQTVVHHTQQYELGEMRKLVQKIDRGLDRHSKSQSLLLFVACFNISMLTIVVANK